MIVSLVIFVLFSFLLFVSLLLVLCQTNLGITLGSTIRIRGVQFLFKITILVGVALLNCYLFIAVVVVVIEVFCTRLHLTWLIYYEKAIDFFLILEGLHQKISHRILFFSEYELAFFFYLVSLLIQLVLSIVCSLVLP